MLVLFASKIMKNELGEAVSESSKKGCNSKMLLVIQLGAPLAINTLF